jgi:hypothetical protein
MQQSFFNPTCMGSQVLSYQIFLIIRWHLSWPKFLPVICYSWCYTWSCTTIQKSSPFGYLLHLLVQGHQCPLLWFLESS